MIVQSLFGSKWPICQMWAPIRPISWLFLEFTPASEVNMPSICALSLSLLLIISLSCVSFVSSFQTTFLKSKSHPATRRVPTFNGRQRGSVTTLLGLLGWSGESIVITIVITIVDNYSAAYSATVFLIFMSSLLRRSHLPTTSLLTLHSSSSNLR